VNQKSFIREYPEGHKGCEVTRRKAKKNNNPAIFTSRSFAYFADKKKFSA